MPLYEYKCDQCDEVFEVMQKFSDAPLETHDKCGGTVRRLISAPAIQFKGTGWYITDYARAGSNGGNGSNGKSGEAGSGANGAKSETASKGSEASGK
ncbi:MAG: zinc ribbon domain-containing protein [Bryobacteraceae bacterium]|nr:zinc ribbon domain-containing protein [Bryobacteraceae bacterium]MCX7604471.1 zinc ribbon domain-containing protein [Bryobacteraceae bacterium]